ncbi:MAG: hypothetical protein ACOCSP_00775 [archaeon]
MPFPAGESDRIGADTTESPGSVQSDNQSGLVANSSRVRVVPDEEWTHVHLSGEAATIAKRHDSGASNV